MTTQANSVIKALGEIRAIPCLYSDDIKALVAALSCQIAKDINSHLHIHQIAVDSLDDLANYIGDKLSDLDR